MTPDNARQYVFPIRTGIGAVPGRNLVILTIVYKLSPDEPEEFEARFALYPNLAESIISDLQQALRDLHLHG